MHKLFHLLDNTFAKQEVKSYKELWTKLEKQGYKGLELDCFTQMKRQQNDGNDNLFTTVFSDAKEDRHGDIVKQNFELKSFKKNPVLLDSHNNMSIESVIGKVKNIKVQDNKLQGDIVFAKDENPRAEVAFKLVNGGFVNTTSIGFIPIEFDEKTGDIVKSELLEISLVGVPANPRALIEKLYESDNAQDAKDKEDNGETTEDDSNGGEDGGGESGEETGGSGRDEKGKKDYKKKELENWDNGDSEVRYKVRDLAEFEDGSLERTTIKTSIPRIEAIVGTLKGANKQSFQTLFFPKADGWTLDDAKKWVVKALAELLGARDNDTDSISMSKPVIGKKKSLLDILVQENNKKIKLYNKVYGIVKTIGEVNEAKKAPKAVRKGEISAINKCIRELIHNKK